MPLMLFSPAFPSGGEIPAEYTCDGADISPPLAWSGVPDGTRSLLLLIEPGDRAQDVPRAAQPYAISSIELVGIYRR